MTDFESQLRAMIAPLVDEAVTKALAIRTRPAEYLSPSEAAKVASVAPATIRRWVREGRIVGHAAGRHVRVLRADLEALLGRGRSVVTPTLSPEALARRRFG